MRAFHSLSWREGESRTGSWQCVKAKIFFKFFSCVDCASCKAKSYKPFLDVQEGKTQKCVSLEIATKQQTKKQPKGSLQWVVACMEEVLLGVSLFCSEDRFNEAELCVLNLEWVIHRDCMPSGRLIETLVLTFTLKRVCTNAAHSLLLAEDDSMDRLAMEL